MRRKHEAAFPIFALHCRLGHPVIAQTPPIHVGAVPRKYEAGSRPPQALVRGGRDNVAVGEGIIGLPGRDQPRDVRHVRHEVRADFIRDL